VELVRASYSPEDEGAQVVGYDPSSGKSRDGNEVYAEQVAQAAAAVAAAVNTNDGYEAQVQAWMDGRLDAEGAVVSPGPAHPAEPSPVRYSRRLP
jgi:hypothetical protein